jgi:hypothetical protein
MDRDDQVWWSAEDPIERQDRSPAAGPGEVLLALLAPVDDLALTWIDRLRAADEPVRVVVAYEPAVGMFPYVPRSDHTEADEAARALVMLDRTARALPATDPSDVASWCALSPSAFADEIEAAAATSTRLVVSWPVRHGFAEVSFRMRAAWLARRFTRDTLRPAYRVPYPREPIPV